MILLHSLRGLSVVHPPTLTSARPHARPHAHTLACPHARAHAHARCAFAPVDRTLPYNFGALAVPRISVGASAQVSASGKAMKYHLSIVHTHPHADTTLRVELRGFLPPKPEPAPAPAPGDIPAAVPKRGVPTSRVRLESATLLTASKMGAEVRHRCRPVTFP